MAPNEQQATEQNNASKIAERIKEYWQVVLEFLRQQKIVEQVRFFLREEVRSLFD